MWEFIETYISLMIYQTLWESTLKIIFVWVSVSFTPSIYYVSTQSIHNHRHTVITSNFVFDYYQVGLKSFNGQHSRYSTVTGDPDTHEDFQPTRKFEGGGISVKDIVEQVIFNIYLIIGAAFASLPLLDGGNVP